MTGEMNLANVFMVMVTVTSTIMSSWGIIFVKER